MRKLAWTVYGDALFVAIVLVALSLYAWRVAVILTAFALDRGVEWQRTKSASRLAKR